MRSGLTEGHEVNEEETHDFDGVFLRSLCFLLFKISYLVF